MKQLAYQLTDTSTLEVWEEFASLADASRALSEIRGEHGVAVFDNLALLEVEDGTYLKSIQGKELLDLAHPPSVGGLQVSA